MNVPTNVSSFFVAPFAIDGEAVGLGETRLANLSQRWLDFCAQILDSNGMVFRITLPAPFDRIALRFTASAGTALVSFFVDGQLVVSAAFLSGDDLSAEKELLGLFVASLQRTDVVQQSRSVAAPFSEVFGLAKRPLQVVVPCVTPDISDEDHTVVQQLCTHLAGTFFCREKSRAK